MWEASLQGLLMVLQPIPMLVMVVGMVLSTIVAILPGIGSPALIAMCLPFAMNMSPPSAIALLVSMHAVANTASGITSSLVGIPGSSASVATILDGFPLAKKGEGARASGAAVWSSVLGGVFGAILLTAVLPILRPIVLAMGSPEFLMLTLWGISMVAMLSGKAKIKGFIAAGVGIMLMMIGMDPKSGTERWVFGQAFLWEGIDLILVSMGVSQGNGCLDCQGLGNIPGGVVKAERRAGMQMDHPGDLLLVADRDDHGSLDTLMRWSCQG